jgi:hypothetical protein
MPCVSPTSKTPGTRIEQTGVPDAIPLEMCYLGWQASLANLAQLVQPEIDR